MFRIRSLIILFQIFFTIHSISFPQSLTEDTKKDSTGKDKGLEFYFLNEKSLAFRSSISENFNWKISMSISASIRNDELEMSGATFEHQNNSGSLLCDFQIFTSLYSQAFWSLECGIGPTISYSESYSKYINKSSGEETVGFWSTIEYGGIISFLAYVSLSERAFMLAKYNYTFIYTDYSINDLRYTGPEYNKSWRTEISNIIMGIGIFL